MKEIDEKRVNLLKREMFFADNELARTKRAALLAELEYIEAACPFEFGDMVIHEDDPGRVYMVREIIPHPWAQERWQAKASPIRRDGLPSLRVTVLGAEGLRIHQPTEESA